MKALYFFLPTRMYRIKKMNYTGAEIEAAAREKEAILNSRRRSNVVLNPLENGREIHRAGRRRKRIRERFTIIVRSKQPEKSIVDNGTHCHRISFDRV